MNYIYVSPGKYIQGKGLLTNIAEYTDSLGKKPFVLLSAGGMKRFGDLIRKSFEDQGIDPVMQTFGGECTEKEIQHQAEIADSQNCDYAIGIGGGKVTDTAKFVACRLKLPTVVCPTIAATDAPTPGRAVLYSEEGVSLKTFQLPRNPELVLVDAEIIAKAPVRLLVSGMGDAMATNFEARACYQSGAGTCAGGKVGVAALGIAKLCYDTLIAEGVKAKAAVDAGACTTAVEKIIEANTLLSGIGFESGGLAGAHAIHNGLTVLPECHHMQHGEKVNFGTLTQLVLENMPIEDLEDILDWMTDIGLPVTFEELGITDTSREHLMPVAVAACAENDTIHNLPFEVDPEKVYNAMLAADRFGRLTLGKY